MRHHRWRWLFFPFVFLLSNVVAQLALIDTPCLQRCFIRECNNLGYKCVCGVILGMVPCADDACGGSQGTGRPALTALARECGFTFIIPTLPNPPAISTRPRASQTPTPTPQPPSPQPPATTPPPPPPQQTPQPMVDPPATTMMPAGSDPNDIIFDMNPSPLRPITSQTPVAPTISTGAATEDDAAAVRARKIAMAVTIPLAVIAAIAAGMYAFFHRRRRVRFFQFRGRRNSIRTFIGEDPPAMQQLPWDFPAPPTGRGSRDLLAENDPGRRNTEEFLRVPRAPEQARSSTRGSRILTPREPIVRGVGPYT